ncbi:MAG TPA: PqiC family protein [Candidatus Binataceae bacterium]
MASAGCTILAPQKDDSKFFVLTPVSDGAVSGISPAALGRDFSVGVGPIKFPGYLQRREVVTRVSSTQVDLSSEKRWAEPLDSDFQRVLCQNLATMLGTQRIVSYPWYATADIAYQVEVQVLRFDTSSDGQSQLTARWSIKDVRTGKELSAMQTTTSSPVAKGDGAGSEALSRDLGDLSRQIATQITELNEQGSKERRAASTGTGGALPY